MVSTSTKLMQPMSHNIREENSRINLATQSLDDHATRLMFKAG